MNAAAISDGGLRTLPYVTYSARALAAILLLLSAPSSFPDPWAWLAALCFGPAGPGVVWALALGILLPLAHRPLSNRHHSLQTQSWDFAERFAAALAPPPPARPILRELPANRSQLILSACRRAAAKESHRLNRGIPSLATIVATAPFFGVLGTAIGIISSFKGVSGEKSAILAATANSLSEAMIFTAWALAVAIVAYVARQVLQAKHQTLERQRDTLSLSIANALRE